MSSLVLVTGATSGIGRETARRLARRGAHVIVHGRDRARVDAVVDEIGSAHPGVVADFGSLASVAELADSLARDAAFLDVLVNNAGTYELERATTVDGYERTFQVNHLAPFLLTHRLLPMLGAAQSARIVTVASSAYTKASLDFADLMHERSYDAYRAYADSKLANVLFGYALARKLEPSGVTSNCIDPGATDTRMLGLAHPDYDGRPVGEAADGIVCAALDEVGAENTGAYLRDCVPRHTTSTTHDVELQDRLWTTSEELVAAALERSAT